MKKISNLFFNSDDIHKNNFEHHTEYTQNNRITFDNDKKTYCNAENYFHTTRDKKNH